MTNFFDFAPFEFFSLRLKAASAPSSFAGMISRVTSSTSASRGHSRGGGRGAPAPNSLAALLLLARLLLLLRRRRRLDVVSAVVPFCKLSSRLKKSRALAGETGPAMTLFLRFSAAVLCEAGETPPLLVMVLMTVLL